MGAVVLLVAGLFVYFAWKTAEIQAAPGYEITARFFKVGGLSRGSDVQISGIKVGTVRDVRLDPGTFDAVVTMTVERDVEVPDDSVASIDSLGLLGGKFVRLEPGRSKSFIPPGGRLSKTEDYRSLEDQVGEIIFLATTAPKAEE